MRVINVVKEPSVILWSLTGFWYLALFPGRLPFDSSEAIRLIHKNESSNSWTSAYFFFLHLTTFNGRYLFLSTAIGLFCFKYAVDQTFKSFTFDKTKLNRHLIIFYLTPFYGYIGCTVSHDVFLISSILLMVTFIYENLTKVNPREISRLFLLIIYICSLFTYSGIVLVMFFTLYLIIRKTPQISISLFIFYMIAQIGAYFYTYNSQDLSHGSVMRALFSNVKCIVQDERGAVSEKDKLFLGNITSYENWKIPVSCLRFDNYVKWEAENKISHKYKLSDLRGILHIYLENPSLALKYHILKSQESVPPPFTLIMKDNKEFEIIYFHTSVDEPSVDFRIPFLNIFRFVGLSLGVVFNQAGWFIGWGGLWLLFIFYFWQRIPMNSDNFVKRFVPLIPIFIQHSILFTLGPASIPRYTSCTTTFGILLLISSTGSKANSINIKYN